MMVRFIKIAGVMAAVLGVFGISAYLTLTMLIRSEDTVVVPDLVGKDTVQSLQMLSDLGLNTKVKGSEYHDAVPENHVIFQDPEPGMEIKKGRSIRIVISKGSGTAPMPNLMGLTLQEARLIIEDNGFCLGVESHAYDGTVEKNRIFGHTPAPGITLPRGSCVDVLIGSGRRPNAYSMPDLTALGVDRAIEKIGTWHLKLGQIRSARLKNGIENAVIEQDPPAGRRVLGGMTVHLVVNRDPFKKERSFSEADGFIRHRVACGFLKKQVRVHMEGYGITGDLFETFVSPGEEIWFLVPTAGRARIDLYEDGKPVLSRVYD